MVLPPFVFLFIFISVLIGGIETARSLHDILTDTQYTNSSLSDFYFNLNYVLNDQHSLSLIVFESEDEVSYNENQFMAKSSSSVYALKWDFLIGDKMFLKTIASNNEVQQYLKNEQIYSGKAGAYMNLNPTQLKLFQSLYYVYNRHKFQIGYEYVNHRDGIDANISISDIPSTKVFDKTSASKTITYPIEGNSIALFADYAADWGKLTTDVGARAERYGPTEKFSMSYKTEAGYDILDDLNLYAKHSRSIAHPDMYYYIGKKNPDFEDAVTMYFGMGSLYEFMKNGIFQSELFYNKYDNMNPGTLVTMNRDEFKKLMQLHPFSQEISGYDYGLELMLKSRYQNYYGWMSYTYTASSRENKTASDFESDFSQPHLFKVTAASFWGKWNPSLVYNLFSSMPYTPAAVVTDVNGNPVNGYGKINSERYGISSRLDMKVNYYYDKETRLYFEVWNILYNSNEVASSYDAGKTISGSNPKKYEDIPILVWAGMEICF